MAKIANPIIQLLDVSRDPHSDARVNVEVLPEGSKTCSWYGMRDAGRAFVRCAGPLLQERIRTSIVFAMCFLWYIVHGDDDVGWARRATSIGICSESEKGSSSK